MAKTLKRRVNTATFNWDENSIDLRAEFQAMELLSEAVGMDATQYIMSVQHPREMAEVFYHLQHDSEFERDEIYDAFFASTANFINPEFQMELAGCIAILQGADKQKVLDELAAINAKEDDAAPKKSAD